MFERIKESITKKPAASMGLAAAALTLGALFGLRSDKADAHGESPLPPQSETSLDSPPTPVNLAEETIPNGLRREEITSATLSRIDLEVKITPSITYPVIYKVIIENCGAETPHFEATKRAISNDKPPSFSLPGPGRYRVKVEAVGWKAVDALVDISRKTHTLEIPIEPIYSFSGSVIDAITGKPLTSYTVTPVAVISGQTFG
ncbi:MAG: hypothetical protein D6808_05170, partial [Candidatus Dadabacteria bacterium]